jgi:hypothetical protein
MPSLVSRILFFGLLYIPLWAAGLLVLWVGISAARGRLLPTKPILRWAVAISAIAGAAYWLLTVSLIASGVVRVF